MKSLRTRMLVGTIAGSLAVVSVAAGGLYATFRRMLQDDFNATLAAKAKVLTGIVEQDNDKIELEIDYRTMREFEVGPGCEYFQLLRPDGTVLFRSRSLADGRLDGIPAKEGSEAFASILLPDGRRGRLVSITFRPREGSEDEPPQPRRAHSAPLLTLSLARETGPLDHTLSRLTAILVAVVSGAMLVCALVLGVIVRRGLRPLDHLAGQIGRIGDDLSVRLDPANAPAELLPIARRLNDLLGRLQAAFVRERRFTADVAHELRTPLAGLRSTLEVCLAKRREPAGYESALADCLDITRQMQAMVDNLLSLARLETGEPGIQRQCVDLPHMLQECWSPLHDQAEERKLQVRWRLEPGCTLETHRESLRHILHNILDNAVTYANPGGEVWIEAGRSEGAIVLRVANTGSLVSPTEVTHVFERFWRGDQARHGTGAHCGLGLSLARELAALLGATMTAQSESGGIFAVILSWPADYSLVSDTG